jgi:hypothetical protein
MRKSDRIVRQLLERHPHVKLDSTRSGITLVAPNGDRKHIGVFGDPNENNLKRLDAWCRKHR